MAEDLNIAGGMPPAFRNHLVPTGCDTPASSAASSLLSPLAIARQNLFCSSRPAADGRPGDGNGARPDRADRRFRMFTATSNLGVLRRPPESAQYVSIKYTERLTEAGIEPSVGSVGDSYDNALAETINGLYKAVPSARAMAKLRSRRVRDPGMGGLVQQPATPGAHRQHSAGRSRATLLRHAGTIRHGGMT